MEGDEAMEPKSERKLEGRTFKGLEVTRRNLLKVAGVSALALGGGAFQAGCAPPTDDLIDALCDTFIPGDRSIPGIGPGAIEGGMRCLMADIMGQENLNMIVDVMGLLYPDFPYRSYPERAAIMDQVRQTAELSDIFYGLREATGVAFYTELMGQGPTPCGDPSFPGSFPLIGIPKFTEGTTEDLFDCDLG
jgi:hypothetical protein